MRVALFATMPRDSYSGGRYYVLMLAEALAHSGHEVHLCANHKPIFYDDLAAYPTHDAIQLWLTDDYVNGLPEGTFDAIFLVPGSDLPGFYDRAELFAINRSAHLVFVNFESGNWFNSLSPVPKPLSFWSPWIEATRNASVILSISQEGNTWAQDFYTASWSFARFDYCYPPINTRAADEATDEDVEPRILLFARFSTSQHKGVFELDRIFCEAMRDHTLVIVLGNENVPSNLLEKLVEQCTRYNVRLELKRKLSDAEKFREYERAKLVLFPSQFEGFGYPPVEAQYCNTHCVAFDLPVLRETCGDRLYLAKNGDWDAFRDEISDALTHLRDTAQFRTAVQPLVELNAASQRLNSILGDLLRVELPSRERRAARLRLRERLRINDLPLRVNHFKKDTRDFALRCAAAVIRRVHRLRRKSHRVCYYPEFDSTEHLSNHVHRARWYLPFVQNHCEHVDLYQSCGDAVNPIPDYMASPPLEPTHIHIRKGALRNFISLLSADLVLVWKKDYASKYLIFLARFCGIKVVNIATDDLAAKEYGAYCSLIWSYLTYPAQRDAILASHQERFNRIAHDIESRGFERACVFGTGPSLARAHEFDYDRSLNIVCNSIVQNQELLDRLNPVFICAGDVVSHLGISAYAHAFREDLFKALRERDMIFVTTASFGALILYHYPDLEGKMLLLPQDCEGPNFDLRKHFGAPLLDSTLNIHMLPLAATFSKTIWLLGCDGKAKEKQEEDFWAHAEEAQYQDLVDTGLLCHPTFDVHRQMSTYDRYLKSTELTIEEGERVHGIRYASLVQSNVPALASRTLNADENT